jgi:hypothetical protein
MGNAIPLYSQPLTTAERNALPATLIRVGAMIFNLTTMQYEHWNGSAWVAQAGGSGTLTAQPFQQLTTFDHVENLLIAAGVMLPEPTYSVSGQVTGAVVAGVTITMGVFSTTTDSTGNWTIPNVLAGSYTATPSIAGHFFTPSSRSITVTASNVTAQNFTSAVETPVAQMSSTSLIVPQNSTARASVLNIAARTFSNPSALTSLPNTMYPSTYASNRFFVPVPSSQEVRVFDDNFNLVATIATGATNGLPIRVFVVGGKVIVVTGQRVVFVNYNFVTNAWTLGTVLNSSWTYSDATAGAGKIFCTSDFGTTGEIYEVDVAAESGVFRVIPSLSSLGFSLRNIEFGNGKLFIATNSTAARIVDANTLALIAPITFTTPPTAHRMAWAANFFWLNANSEMIRVNDSTGAFTSITPSFGANGIVANSTLVFAANQGSEVRVYDAATGTQNGATLTLGAGWFPKI